VEAREDVGKRMGVGEGGERGGGGGGWVCGGPPPPPRLGVGP